MLLGASRTNLDAKIPIKLVITSLTNITIELTAIFELSFISMVQTCYLMRLSSQLFCLSVLQSYWV